MQNAVYERKQNGEGFFSLPAVTYSRFGNCPANGLVTEQPQYSVIICIFSTWQNAETKLISNGLRFIFTCPLFLAQPITFHYARNTMVTNGNLEFDGEKCIVLERQISIDNLRTSKAWYSYKTQLSLK